MFRGKMFGVVTDGALKIFQSTKRDVRKKITSFYSIILRKMAIA